MPLDAGAVAQDSAGFAGAGIAGSPTGAPPALGGAATIGAALRAAREYRGLSRQDLADATRIRANYLAALEDMNIDALPSRPFTIGYVRAYAQALELNADEAVAMFKRDVPVTAEPLRPPVGVSRQRDPRLALAGGAAAFVVTAVLAWNLAQHAVAKDDPSRPALPEAAASVPPPPPSGKPVVLSAAEPAPQESDVPTPYVTPGLAAEVAAKNLSAPGAPAPPPVAEAPVETAPPAPPTFEPKGAVYGAQPGKSQVTLQARKPASLVIRGGDGTVYFARQLAAGEAYRAPLLKGLTVDVSDPLAFNVYSGGALISGLQAPQTPIGKLSG
jgi:cytoskeletal protein RodZ